MNRTAAITSPRCDDCRALSIPRGFIWRPGTKLRLSLFLIFATGTALLTHVTAAAAALAAAVLLLALPKGGARLPAGAAKLFFAVNLFIAFLWLITPCSTPGSVIAQIGPAGITREGVLLSATVTIKCNATLTAYLALISAERASRLIGGLRTIGLPEKLCVLMLLMIRSIDSLKRELTALREAALLRGFSARCDAHSYRTLSSFVSIIFIRAFARSRKLEETLLLRGFANVWPLEIVQGLTAAERFLCLAAALAFAALTLFDAGLLPWTL